MAFIDIDYLTNLGFRIPQSSVSNVETQLNQIITNAELEYLQNTIGYELTTNLYALVEPYPTEVDIFLNGNLVDGENYYKGVLYEISNFIMAFFYGGLSINVNNSGFSSPISDGENMIEPNFIVNNLFNRVHRFRPLTYNWLTDNANDFFADWECEYFKPLERPAVW